MSKKPRIHRKRLPYTPKLGNWELKQPELKKVKEYKADPVEYKERKRLNIKKSLSRIFSAKNISFLGDISLYLPTNNLPIQMLKIVKRWFQERGKEPSTYQGLTMLLGVVGFSISPQDWETISAFVVSLIGLIQMIKKERVEPKIN